MGIALAVIFGIIIIFALASFLLRMFIGKELNVFSITPFAFPVIISSGVLAFFGYYFASKGHVYQARLCFNLSVVVTFFGILMFESAMFGAFLVKISLPYQPCEKEENPINIASCIMTGYKTSEEYIGWQWASFWIFFIILPFAFIFSLLWGFLSGIRLLPRPAMMVISFVLASYATRQVFGTFLLDIAAYGTWGVAGIFIPLFLSFMLKRVFDAFLASAEAAKETLYGMIGAHWYASVENIRRELEDIKKALQSPILDPRTLENLKSTLDSLQKQVGTLNDEVKSMKGLGAEIKTTLETQIQTLRNEINALREAAEQRSKQIHWQYKWGTWL